VLTKLTSKLRDMDRWKVEGSDLVYVPMETPDDSEELKSNMDRLLEDLAANNDVTNVWTTLD
jgi:transcriptional/translational regulatory protein YebC/TACO1